MQLLLSALLLVAFVAVTHADDAAWEEYKEKHNLKFEKGGETIAKGIFLANLALVEQNEKDQQKRANKPKIGLAINSNSHMSHEQFRKGALGLNKSKIISGTRRLKNEDAGKPVKQGYRPDMFQVPARFPSQLPQNFDWRTYGIVNAPSNQNPCGDCFIFSGIAALEPQLAMATGKKVKLSEQHVRDCIFTGQFSQFVADSCQGGDQTNIYQLASELPILPAASYPYQNDEATRKCPGAPRGSLTTGVTSIGMTKGEENMMKALIAIGPLAASLNADDLADNFSQWDGRRPSMYPAQRCSTELNHAVTLIGFGQDQVDGKYWLVQNSWGPDWATDGTFKMPRGRNACGFEMEVTWPCLNNNCYPQNNPAIAKLMG